MGIISALRRDITQRMENQLEHALKLGLYSGVEGVTTASITVFVESRRWFAELGVPFWGFL